MNKTLTILLSIALMLSFENCSDAGDKKFNPEKNAEGSGNNDVERERLIKAKKERFASGQNTNADQQILQFDGKVKLTVMVPADQGLAPEENKALESKMIQMVSANGIGGMGGNPRFIIAPIVSVLKKEATSTAPVRYSINYEVVFYVADILTGSVYGSYGMKYNGVESSETRAFLTGFENLNVNDAGLQQFLKTAQDKIIKYYNDNSDKLIAEANSIASQKKYTQAIALLESIPMEADVAFGKASKISPQIFQQYLDNECETVLAMLKSSLGTYNNQSAAGYNTDAMGYYKLIPAGGKCKKEADAIYANYKKGLAPQKIIDWEKAEKEWQLKASQQNADNDYKKLQEELKSKVAIQGNSCLLQKYKKDAAYDRLPWLRKLIFLGDYDPFDGYTPSNDCN
jgi:hypothetical protein